MKQAQKITGQRMMLLAAQPEHAAFIFGLRMQERKQRVLSGQVPSVEEQIAWMREREKLADDAYFVICEIDHPDKPLGTIRLHDANHEEHSIRVSSWVMVDGVAPKKTFEALALAVDYLGRSGYACANFEVRKNNHAVLRLYLRLGAQIMGETDTNFLLEASPYTFLENMAATYHTPVPSILQIMP